jgi:hypothetical protein
MKNYVLIYNVGETLVDTDEMNAAWGAWFESMGDAVVDGGNPFNPAAEAQIKNGKVAMDKTSLAGYSVIKAENHEAAVTMAMSCPMAKNDNAWVSVYETMPM